MTYLSFSEIRSIITKCCGTNQTSELSDKYSFDMNISKMENILKQKKTELHALAFNKTIESRVPSYNDIQLVTEYMKDEKEINYTFNGTNQIAELMLYYQANNQGAMEIKDQDGNLITDKELFNLCNNPESLDKEIIFNIVKNMPIYRILIVRGFNTESDRFEYKIYIRSNYNMISFYRDVVSKTTHQQLIDEESTDNENVVSE